MSNGVARSLLRTEIAGVSVADLARDFGTPVYVYDAAQRSAAEAAGAVYGEALRDAGRGELTTEILDVPEFYYAEDYHQQYLAKNPTGYCGLGGTGVPFPGTGLG